MRIISHKEWETVRLEPEPDENQTEKSVRSILRAVAREGDRALRRLTRKFDNVQIEHFRLPHESLEHAEQELDEATIRALNGAATQIRTFARIQLDHLKAFEVELRPGVCATQRLIPIDRVGVYVPGGRYPLPSTVLMTTIPARVAGVQQIILCTPPGPDGRIHPAIRYAAYLAGVDAVYTIGGAQAIAAMAYGTETVPRVDKIVGPGNRYVATAKRLLYGIVGIDMPAGPSELLVLADESAPPEDIAIDLIAQAEHDPDARVWFVTPDNHLIEAVLEHIRRWLEDLPTHSIARQALDRNGIVIRVPNMDTGIAIANRIAPEHLELFTHHPDVHVPQLRHYGSLFLGPLATTALGDYSSGLNHTLPTRGMARTRGGLSVYDFIKVQTTLSVTEEGLENIGPIAIRLAEIEGLLAHARSISHRLARIGVSPEEENR